MAATVNPTLGMIRDELNLVVEPLAARVTALEDTVGDRRGKDYVGISEFRLFKWLGTFILATVVAGFGFLYEQVSDLRVGMERLHGELLQEMSGVRERVVRIETILENMGSATPAER